MIYKENYFNDQTNIEELELPSSIFSLLKEFGDVFPNEIPSGLPSNQEGKGELAIQGKSSNTQVVWKDFNKTKSEKFGAKAESEEGEMALSEKGKGRQEWKNINFYLIQCFIMHHQTMYNVILYSTTVTPNIV